MRSPPFFKFEDKSNMSFDLDHEKLHPIDNEIVLVANEPSSLLELYKMILNSSSCLIKLRVSRNLETKCMALQEHSRREYLVDGTLELDVNYAQRGILLVISKQ